MTKIHGTQDAFWKRKEDQSFEAGKKDIKETSDKRRCETKVIPSPVQTC